MIRTSLLLLTITKAAADSTARRIRSGETTSVEETSRFLDQIARHEGAVQACASLHHGGIEAARERDAEAPRLRLHTNTGEVLQILDVGATPSPPPTASITSRNVPPRVKSARAPWQGGKCQRQDSGLLGMR